MWFFGNCHPGKAATALITDKQFSNINENYVSYLFSLSVPLYAWIFESRYCNLVDDYSVWKIHYFEHIFHVILDLRLANFYFSWYNLQKVFHTAKHIITHCKLSAFNSTKGGEPKYHIFLQETKNRTLWHSQLDIFRSAFRLEYFNVPTPCRQILETPWSSNVSTGVFRMA